MSTINTSKTIAVAIWNRREPHPAIKKVYEKFGTVLCWYEVGKEDAVEIENHEFVIGELWSRFKKAVEG